MKIWDRAWAELVKRESLIVDLVVRYVDDVRVFLPSLNEGWEWNGSNFSYSSEKRKRDIQEGKSDSERTTTEITKAMCSMVTFLKFTGEEQGMFPNNRLPTLDVELWPEARGVNFGFYEKPQVPNRVIMKGTTLPESTVRSSLLQEVVRRMENCCVGIPDVERTSIISKFAQKMVNSGHCNNSTRITIVHGVMKYLDNLRLSRLPNTHPHYRPMYLEKKYKEGERQLTKQGAKLTWFGGGDKNKGREWRTKLQGQWRGARPLQKKVNGMQYTTVLQVPSTRSSRLLVELAKSENRLARLTGYTVKLTEKKWCAVSTLFQ